jgi:hypothetical protein
MCIKNGILQQEHLMFCGILQASKLKEMEVGGKEKLLLSIPNKREVGDPLFTH